MVANLFKKIERKGLGITVLRYDAEFEGDEKDRPWKVSINNLEINEEIVKLMEIYNIHVEDAIAKGVRCIVKSYLDKELETN